MSAPNVTVTLKAGYLARHVCLVAVYRADDTATPWHIMARDYAGGTHGGVTVEGKPAPKLESDDQARAYLVSLMASGADIVKVWAEPAERITRAYLTPSATGPGLIVRAA